MSSDLNRRTFLHVAAATTVAAPALITAKRSAAQDIVGDGAFKFRCEHSFPKLPDRYTWQTTHNVAVDPDNNLYVAQYGTNDNGTIISKVTLAGTVSTLASGGLITVPNGITFDGDGNLYCINTYNRNINRITPEGDVSTFATLPAGGGGFLGGSMVTVNGKIYVTSPDRNVIYQVTEGNVTVFAGSGAPGNADGQGTAATFTRPLGLTTNAAKTKLFSTTYEQANASLRVTEL